MVAYQDFGDGKSDSKSSEKLKRIRLPEDLTGKRVLDIGCNEGFFCHQALARGASYVLGVDSNPDIIEKAKQRVPDANFRTTSWWDIPEEKFDIILFLSAIHYEMDQKALLNFLRSRLSPNGILVLECGVIADDWDEKWYAVERHDAFLSFPSWGLLLNNLLENFAVRDMGRSVDQVGDPISRYVFHCQPLKPTVLFLSGESKAGKTVLSREFRKKGCRVINLDFEYGRMIRSNTQFRRFPAFKYLIDVYDGNNISLMLKKIVADGKMKELNWLISYLVRPDDSLTILEGYHLSIPELSESLKDILSKRGYVVREMELH